MTGITAKSFDDPSRNGTPMDRRVHKKEGLDWDLIRSNYNANASEDEREWQEASIDGVRDSKKNPKPLNTAAQRKDRGKRLTGDDKQDILKYYSVGMRVDWIAGEVGFSRSTVREFLKREGKIGSEEEDDE